MTESFDLEKEAYKVVASVGDSDQAGWIDAIIAYGRWCQDEGLEKALKEIPTNWIDPLLTGETRVILKSPCPEIEALLNALRERIGKLKSK